MNILGLSFYYHDSSAALVQDGTLVAAAEEERFSRVKHDSGFPVLAIEFVCKRGRHHARTTSTSSSSTRSPSSSSSACCSPRWRPSRARRPCSASRCSAGSRTSSGSSRIMREAPGPARGSKILFAEHHVSHAASSFFTSPFEESAILTIDGAGEWTTSTIGRGRGTKLEMLEGAALPALARPLVLGLHRLLRLRGQRGRVQADGHAPLRRAASTWTRSTR